MGARFTSFDGNKSYLMGAIAQIDNDNPEEASVTLARCVGDIDPEGLSTPINSDDPDYEKYRRLNQIVVRAKDLLSSDPQSARRQLVAGLSEFGWLDEAAAAKGE
jgi:hypothetical protein